MELTPRDGQETSQGHNQPPTTHRRFLSSSAALATLASAGGSSWPHTQKPACPVSLAAGKGAHHLVQLTVNCLIQETVRLRLINFSHDKHKQNIFELGQ